MQIELVNGVVFDTESKVQEEGTCAWVRENVLSKLGMSAGEEGMINPEIDRYKRPYRWHMETETASITISRQYVEENSPSWAMKQDIIEVEPKED